MNTYLTNSVNTGDLVIINTYDEPNNRRTTFRDVLVNKFYAKLQYSGTWASRCSYQLVAIAGKGVIYENIKPRYSSTGINTSLVMR
jgi:hypothetical protein